MALLTLIEEMNDNKRGFGLHYLKMRYVPSIRNNVEYQETVSVLLDVSWSTGDCAACLHLYPSTSSDVGYLRMLWKKFPRRMPFIFLWVPGLLSLTRVLPDKAGLGQGDRSIQRSTFY